ncbi:MAG TPA: methyltransferase domain-containing protein [Blastocatellia bacterium]|nr:methyltransferase domain-containing protein [Blastocatellia bacterium]
MTAPVMDQTKAEKFAEKMLNILNDGSLALMISIGHRTGLFDALGELPPSPSHRIAEAAGLNERYVREWLGALVTGRIVEYDPASGSYHLPREHAAALTRAAGENNMAATVQFLPLLASVEDRIIDSFRNGGGVPYSAFPRFQEVMAEEGGKILSSALIKEIVPLVPGLDARLRSGLEVLDVGCGKGFAMILLAEAYPESRFAGYDISEEGIAGAAAEARRRGLSNVRFEVKDVAALDEPERYGLITAFDAIHDQAHPAEVLRGIAGSLKRDGVFLMQDIAASSHVHKNLDHPIAPYLYAVSCMHCMTVSLAQGGDGLGTVWGEETARRMLEEAGFAGVEVKQITQDIINSYYVARKAL